jgi:4-hydroxy-tetrahydrodipicolinate reductase
MNKRLAELLNQYSQYKVNINETHHINKLDAPSGTAITLAENIIETQKNYERWALKESGDNILTINSTRIGEVHGTHVVTYESQDDIIEIKHESKNRRGFALGAVLAAEFLYGKTGYFGMKDLLNL